MFLFKNNNIFVLQFEYILHNLRLAKTKYYLPTLSYSFSVELQCNNILTALVRRAHFLKGSVAVGQ